MIVVVVVRQPLVAWNYIDHFHTGIVNSHTTAAAEEEEHTQVEGVLDACVHSIHRFFDEHVHSDLYSLEYALFALAPVVFVVVVVVEQDDEQVAHNNRRPTYALVKQRLFTITNLPQVDNNHPPAPVLLLHQSQIIFENLPIHFHQLVCVQVVVVVHHEVAF